MRPFQLQQQETVSSWCDPQAKTQGTIDEYRHVRMLRRLHMPGHGTCAPCLLLTSEMALSATAMARKLEPILKPYLH